VAHPDLGEGTRLAASSGAWIVFEDEAGATLRPPKARTWACRGHTPQVAVSGRGGRVSMAALVCYRPGSRSRLFYRVLVHRRRTGERRSFSEQAYAALIAAAHLQLTAPIILIWDKCAVWRFAASPTHSGGIWRNIPGSPDSPGGESRRGQQHVRKAVVAGRRSGRCAARPARYGQGWIA
jgi:hypothetical protein